MERVKDLTSTGLLYVGVAGDMNNGIKKDALGKDGARVWVKDDVKLQNLSNSLVRVITFSLKKYIYIYTVYIKYI